MSLYVKSIDFFLKIHRKDGKRLQKYCLQLKLVLYNSLNMRSLQINQINLNIKIEIWQVNTV